MMQTIRKGVLAAVLGWFVALASAQHDLTEAQIRSEVNAIASVPDLTALEREAAKSLSAATEAILANQNPDEIASLGEWARRWRAAQASTPLHSRVWAAASLFAVAIGSLVHQQRYFAALPDCPCKASEAAANPDVWTTGAWLVRNGWPACDETHHRGAVSGYRSTSAAANGPGQQCCYDKSGALITAGAAAGTPDIVGPAVSWGSPYESYVAVRLHTQLDVRTWNQLGWAIYNQFWQPNRGPAGASCADNRVLRTKETPAPTAPPISRLGRLPEPDGLMMAEWKEKGVTLTLGRKSYRVGDGIKVGVRCERGCYYALVHAGPGGFQRVAPGSGDPERIEPGEALVIPREGVIRVTPPVGQESFILITSEEGPVDADGLAELRIPGGPGVAYTFASYEIVE